MAFDPPRPGQVINDRYLWSAEHRKGHQEGAKERPTAVVYTADNAAGKTRVYVLPITHSPPTSSERSVELLPQWKMTSWPGRTAILDCGQRDEPL